MDPIAAVLGRLGAERFVIDGELIISSGGAVAFDALQSRFHPAESRIRKLSAATPAMLLAFDRLTVGKTMLAAKLAFRGRTPTGFRRVRLPLDPRSAYHLSGEVRREWEHGISAHDALRFSITFRSVSPGR